MMFQTQKRTDRPANVVALCLRTARRTAFDTTILLQPAMIALDRPDLLCRRGTLVHRHCHIATRPIFRVTVWGVNPKHQDNAIAFEMHRRVSQCQSYARMALRLARELYQLSKAT